MNVLTFVALVYGILLPTSAIVAHKFSSKTKQDPTVWYWSYSWCNYWNSN